MASVTQRISEITQPRGGYIKPSEFIKTEFSDGVDLFPFESVHPSLVGLAVDYMSRFILGSDKEDAFRISLMGAEFAEKSGFVSAAVVERLLKGITGLDNKSIANACKLVTFDVWYRNINAAASSRPYNKIRLTTETTGNIRAMVVRSLAFFEKYGPVVQDGFDFKPVVSDKEAHIRMVISRTGTYGGYTPCVSTGDGDFLTADTMWDFKVSKSEPTSKHTLQLLMYYIMGRHSGQSVYDGISKLGIFNPRLNAMYTYDTENLSDDVVAAIERDVLCY